DQGLARSQQAVTLARQMAHPFSLGFALGHAAMLHAFRRELRAAQERAEAAISLTTEQGFPFWMAWGALLRGWALAQQGQAQEGRRAGDPRFDDLWCDRGSISRTVFSGAPR